MCFIVILTLLYAPDKMQQNIPGNKLCSVLFALFKFIPGKLCFKLFSFFILLIFIPVCCLIEKCSLSKLPFHKTPVIGKGFCVVAMFCQYGYMQIIFASVGCTAVNHYILEVFYCLAHCYILWVYCSE